MKLKQNFKLKNTNKEIRKSEKCSKKRKKSKRNENDFNRTIFMTKKNGKTRSR
jgi:hypothetical protein